MQGRIPVPPDHAYGIKCIGSDTTVGDCLRGWYSEEEQKAEPDLGKCIKVGRRNVLEANRSYGVPSIRSDITKPERRSCADTQNYGDEAGASSPSGTLCVAAGWLGQLSAGVWEPVEENQRS